uniref:Uncharacterized protein n=1 Tax=Arundo donax TaxID=35708 RepID=A0A0A9BDT6_ARUDO
MKVTSVLQRKFLFLSSDCISHKAMDPFIICLLCYFIIMFWSPVIQSLFLEFI